VLIEETPALTRLKWQNKYHLQGMACTPCLAHLITNSMVLNHHMHMHIIYTALRIIWYIKYWAKPIIYLTIPTKFEGTW
jgi:hypothetical protein